MSVTESKAKTERKSSRKPAKTQETVLSALLAQTEEVSVPLASLIKSPLNVRTVPYSAESVSELAESIKGVGLLQNLVVHTLPGDRYGVAAGGRRLAALNMLAERGIIPTYWFVWVIFILQEALSNVRKHAKAQTVMVNIRNMEQFEMTVMDDGIGIDPKVLEERKQSHVGLSIMRERAQKVKAHIEIESELDQGTTVRLILPKEGR